jgi:MFS transporter, NNP family, nitrate/nitrite transporter
LSYYFWHHSDDVPLGSVAHLKATGRLMNRSAADSFRTGVVNVNAWILFCQFAACMGVELAMDSGLALHLSARFNLSTAEAAAYASLFGGPYQCRFASHAILLCRHLTSVFARSERIIGTNLFARGLGGMLSDHLHARFSLKGRLWFQFGLLFTEGLWIYCFIECRRLSSTLAVLVALAVTGQCCIVNSLGIVPYVDRRSTGTISGIAGAGGNLGGVILSGAFRHCTDAQAFAFMSLFCVAGSALTPMIVVSGYEGMVWGEQRTTRERVIIRTSP